MDILVDDDRDDFASNYYLHLLKFVLSRIAFLQLLESRYLPYSFFRSHLFVASTSKFLVSLWVALCAYLVHSTSTGTSTKDTF